jgi:hypothetical protein
MPRRQPKYDEPLMVKLEPELKQRFKVQAARERTDMSKIVRRLVREYLERAEGDGAAADGAVGRMANTATAGLSTDEIMALTRGE